MVSEQNRWLKHCVSETTQGLFEALRPIVHLIVKFELAHKVNLLFHEFCLDQVSRNQRLFLMMTEQIAWFLNWFSLTVEHGILDKVQLVEGFKNLLLRVEYFSNQIVAD